MRRYTPSILIFLATFTVLCVALNVLARRGQVDGLIIEHMSDVPESSIVVLDGPHYVEHAVLHHDLGGFIDRAREADVLILGNSRAQCGFDPAVLAAATADGGPSFYNLACGEGENIAFGRSLIERHDLQPSTVVVPIDHDVLDDMHTDTASEAMETPRWTAYRSMVEGDLRWGLARLLHQWMPRADWFQHPGLRNRWYIARDVPTGSWRLLQRPEGDHPASADEPAGDVPFDAERLADARAFVDAMRERDIDVIFTHIPSAVQSPQQAIDAAAAIDVPLILVSGDDLRTFDRSHLQPESARRFTESFIEQLSALRDRS
jgi:hypothetical protein